MEKNLKEKIGLTIIDIRKEQKISQETLALEAGIGRHYMSDIENGKRNISIDIIERICNHFKMPISEFFARVEKKTDR